MLRLHVSSVIAKFVECSREEIEQQTPNQSPIFFHICTEFTLK